ncbi:hypothetical protein [Caballeronia choica]|uniref:hypothetical protein n=1 Tax=Caballeronia choica TaxID=326476 RepID=UPI0035B5099F
MDSAAISGPFETGQAPREVAARLSAQIVGANTLQPETEHGVHQAHWCRLHGFIDHTDHRTRCEGLCPTGRDRLSRRRRTWNGRAWMLPQPGKGLSLRDRVWRNGSPQAFPLYAGVLGSCHRTLATSLVRARQ